MADKKDEPNVFHINKETMMGETAGGLERRVTDKKRPGLGLKLGIGAALLAAAISAFYFTTKSHPYLPPLLEDIQFNAESISSKQDEIGLKYDDYRKEYGITGGMQAISIDDEAVADGLGAYLSVSDKCVRGGTITFRSSIATKGFYIELSIDGNYLEIFDDAADRITGRIGKPLKTGRVFAQWEYDGKEIELYASGQALNYSVILK